MRFTVDNPAGANVVRGYAAGELKINDACVRGAALLSADALVLLPELTDVNELNEAHLAQVLQLTPEVVLLGTGAMQRFPAQTWSVKFLTLGIGFEAMSTAAACRTFNVLALEQRRVAAILIA